MRNIIAISLACLLALSSSLLSAEQPQVMLKTEKGDILLELNSDKAPLTVDSFLKHVTSFHYDGVIFHRVIEGFMIQSGGHNYDMSARESTRPTIKNESFNGLSNLRGSIAMARMPDPDSAKAQFFINQVDNRRLDGKGEQPGYTVFGRVIEGMSVVDEIAAVKTGTWGNQRDVPAEPIRILSARLLNPDNWQPLPEPEPAQNEAAFERPVPVIN